MTLPDTGIDLDGLLAHLDGVGLEELVATAELQTRKDRKYVVPVTVLPQLVDAIADEGRVLTIGDRTRFRYRSVYFDTPRLDSYLDAARRRPSRFKVRTRLYLDSDLCMLEVKTRDRRGRTVKHREACDPAEEGGLSAFGRAVVGSIDATRPFTSELVPTLTTNYHRTTLLVGSGEAARATIDTSLYWQVDSSDLGLGPFALIETKTTGKPCAVDRLLWQTGHRTTTISKYCTGLALARPELPANKWNRVLRHQLGWVPAHGR